MDTNTNKNTKTNLAKEVKITKYEIIERLNKIQPRLQNEVQSLAIDLFDILMAYMPADKLKKILLALEYGHQKHYTQKRKSGEPYFIHPISVAIILSDLKPDAESIITALLHDVIEDTDSTLEEITKIFGDTVSLLVDGVTKIRTLKNASLDEEKAENLRKFMLAVSKDLRVLLVKLSDRMHNMRTIAFHDNLKSKHRIALETYEIYAPLAERLGMHNIRVELQDLSFKELHPAEFQHIIDQLDNFYSDAEKISIKLMEQLKQALEDANLQADLDSRKKSPYSIWQKMKNRNIAFEQLSDIMAFRILVDSKDDCYMVLGLVHKIFSVLPGNFKDYISMPKANGYQSLHTVVLEPNGHEVEIQIRTRNMHETAENGYAAHLIYKQGGTLEEKRANKWLRDLVKLIETSETSEELLQEAKMSMYLKSIFVFTPDGDILELPKNSSILDFAYLLHEEIGNNCISARINKRIAPIKTKLKTGDVVEIETSKNKLPTRESLNWVVTPRAKSKIRKSIRRQEKLLFLDAGKNILTKGLTAHSIHNTDELLADICKHYRAGSLDMLYTEIGSGRIEFREVLNWIAHKKLNKEALTGGFEAVNDIDDALEYFGANKRKDNNKITDDLFYEIDLSVAHKMANCCHPLPGDVIVGVVASGSQITVHRTNCVQILALNRDHLIDLSWKSNAKDNENQVLTSRISILSKNKKDVLVSVIEILGRQHVGLVNAKSANKSSNVIELLLDVNVQSLAHLENVMRALRTLPYIIYLDRD